MLKILIVDDHPVVRQGIKQIIGTTDDMSVTGEARNGLDAIAMVRQADYDVVLLDMSMPEKNGIETLKELKNIRQDLPVLVLTIHPEKEYALRMLKLGAAGYITKDCLPSELIYAIHKVQRREKYISSSLAIGLAGYLEDDTNNFRHMSLSHREYEVMCKIASGKTVKEIAEELSLSPKTVSTHRLNILSKMKMSKNVEIMHYAIKNSLINW